MALLLVTFLASLSRAATTSPGECSASDPGSRSACRPVSDPSDAASVLQVRGRDDTLAHDRGTPGEGSKLIIKNGCDAEPMWIASMLQEADRHRFPNNVKLQPGGSITFAFPAHETVAATRFWPKLGCDEQGQNCLVGSSGGPGQDCPRRMGCAPPVDTKFEATWWDKNTAEPVDWWDTSGVDGYTVPYTLELDSTCPRGVSLDCSDLTMDDCPKEELLNGVVTDLTLRFEGNASNERIGCYSPCGKLTFDNWHNGPTYAPQAPEANPYCCPTPPVSSEACRTGPVEKTDFVHLFRRKCRGVYSYAYDDAMGLQTCPVGTTYSWTLLCLASTANVSRHGDGN